MDVVKEQLRKRNREQRIRKKLDEESCSLSQNNSKESGSCDEARSKSNNIGTKALSNTMIATALWKLNSWRRRETKFRNIELLYLVLLDADGSIENARKILEEFKKFENPCPVVKIRLSQALRNFVSPIA